MAAEHVALQQFNRGIVSPLAFARTDVQRTQFSAETMQNWMPRVLGSMMLRPGLEYLGSTDGDNAARFIGFIFSTDDTALIEITNEKVRIWESETPVSRETSFTTQLTNGNFLNTTGWTDADDAGATSTLASRNAYLSLIGDGSNFARRRQTVSVAAADIGKQVEMKVSVVRGPVVFRVGSSAGNDTYISEKTLDTGEYAFAFTFYADFVVEFESALEREVLVNSCVINNVTPMEISAPWPASDFDKIRYQKSGDVVFIASGTRRQHRIERYGVGSWGVVEYLPEDGPYLVENLTKTTLTPSALTGNITLTASSPVFRGGHQGALFSIDSDGQQVTANLSNGNTYSGVIKVFGVDSQRVFTIIREGTWVATITLQRSLESDAGPWEDVTTFTTNDVGTYDDALDNQIAWYRLGIKGGDYTSGTAELTLDYPIGSIRGVARITSSEDAWQEQTTPNDYQFQDVAWSSSLSLFVAVSSNATLDTVMSSPDGYTWTSRNASSASLWTSVAWSPTLSLFVAVGHGVAMSSTNGTAWTARTPAAALDWKKVVWSEEKALFVAVAGSGTGNRVMTSTNGTTWTSRTSAADNTWEGLAYSPELDLWCAVSRTGTSRVMTSPDAITWTSRSSSDDTSAWQSVTWSPELSLFCAVSQSTGGEDQIMTSPDGITWTARGDYYSDNVQLQDVKWISEKARFYAVEATSHDEGLYTSADGLTWDIRRYDGAPGGFLALEYSPDLDRFVGVGNSSGVGTDDGAWASVHSSTSVEAEVLKDLGGTNASEIWAEGAWSDFRGWPSSVELAEGRLTWSGKNGVWMSVSDGYYDFNPTTEGDSAPVSRTIGIGPVDTINWILALKRVILGTEGAELVLRSTSFDEPITNTNANLKSATDQGSGEVSAIRVDKTGVFVQRGGTRLMQIAYDGNDDEYATTDLTVLAPEVCQPRVVRIAIQRQPDTRIHCVLSDGTVAVLIYDRAEDVRCWVKVVTDGLIEDAVVLPGDNGENEDKVYYVVNRTINGATKRYLEKWAKESECVGDALNKQADSFLSVSQASSTTISGLTHLEGETVAVWANSKDLGTYTVSSGAITVSEAVTTAIVGLVYTADWKSLKLAYAAERGTALIQKKKVNNLGVIAKDMHYLGLKYGPSFTQLDNLPEVYRGAKQAADTVYSSYDGEAFIFKSEWDTDSRLCLRATAPRPCTLLAAIFQMETREKF